jgi:hypothetical protein
LHIVVTLLLFKLFNGKVELFYKEDEQALSPVCKKSAGYEDGWRYCSLCRCFYQKICPTHGIKLRNSPRKEKPPNKLVFQQVFELG